MAKFEPQIDSTGRDSLDDERKTSIRDALQKYRDTVLRLNMHALEIVLQGIEDEESPDDEWSEDELRVARLSSLRDSYGVFLDPPDDTINHIRDFLSQHRRSTLVASCSLDGVDHGPVHAGSRAAWFARHEDSIARTEGIEPRPEGLPADIKYLATLVRGLCGPGLPEYRAHQQAVFLTDMDRMGDYHDCDRIVLRPSRQQLDRHEYTALASAWEEWDVAVGVRLGDAEVAWSGGYALYCRHRLEAHRGGWKWRYGLKHRMFQSELYDAVEGVLGWYAHYCKQSEEDDNIEIFPLDG